MLMVTVYGWPLLSLLFVFVMIFFQFLFQLINFKLSKRYLLHLIFHHFFSGDPWTVDNCLRVPRPKRKVWESLGYLFWVSKQWMACTISHANLWAWFKCYQMIRELDAKPKLWSLVRMRTLDSLQLEFWKCIHTYCTQKQFAWKSTT